MKKLLSLNAIVVTVMAMMTATAWAGDVDASLVARGHYLVTIAGCNDCHTPGWAFSGGKIPESQWLIGDSIGWQGPWGTTYAANVRLFVKDLSEDQWITQVRAMVRRPPMPWFNLNKMTDDDLRAMYQFIHSLGEPGNPAPAYVPPGGQPTTPVVVFPAPPGK